LYLNHITDGQIGNHSRTNISLPNIELNVIYHIFGYFGVVIFSPLWLRWL